MTRPDPFEGQPHHALRPWADPRPTDLPRPRCAGVIWTRGTDGPLCRCRVIGEGAA